MQYNKFSLLIALALALSAWDAYAAEAAWPPPPIGEPTFKTLESTNAIGAKIERVDISRGTNRIARVSKVHSKLDGKIHEFTFSAFVSGQRVFLLGRLGGTNEATFFYSYDDTIVMNDQRIPESNLVVLIVDSKQHNYYEVFARAADGYYWPATVEERKTVDSFLSPITRTASSK